VPLINRNPQTYASRLRHAREDTGLLTGRGESYLTRLAPHWNQNVTQTEASSSARDLPTLKNPLLSGEAHQQRQWLFPRTEDGQLNTIAKAHDADSLLAQATDKYTDLINKEGYSLRCTETEPQEYIEARFYYMSATTGVPIESVFKEGSRDLIKYGNHFLVKARVSRKMATMRIGGRKVASAKSLHGKDNLQPIGGYYRADPLTFYPIYNQDTGRLEKWQQKIPGKDPKEFKLEQVIHFAYKPPAGKVMGVPLCAPVLDDLRMLRDVEEYIVKLLFKHLFPLLHHEVPDLSGTGLGTDEDVKQTVANYAGMAPDGMLITPPGHKINVVAAATGLDASPYLKHLLQRVLMGLGLSEAIMGLGNAAVGMSDMLTAQMHDRVKSFQQDMERLINLRIILELLMEGGFDPIRKKGDRVELEFNEIEIEDVIRRENHMGSMFGIGGVTEDEYRHAMRKNPLTAAERKNKQIYTDKLPVIIAQIEAQTKGQIEVIREQGKIAKDAAADTAANTKDAATHQAKLNKDGETHKSSLATTGKPAASSPPTASLRAPKLAAKGTNNGLNPVKTASGGSAQGTVTNKDNPTNQHGQRGAPRTSRSPAAGAASKKTPKSAS
jgi:hypothetical protein